MKRLTLTALTAAPAAMLAASPAAAHLDPVAHGSFAAGFSHPLFGTDHVLAMVAVGLWAAMLGGRALATVPAAFVATMVVGFGLAMAGIGLPFVEPMILASVVVFGLIVAAALRPPLAASGGLVALFALFHGHAHGAELGAATPLSFLVGFALGTALLHAAGIGIALLLGRRSEAAIFGYAPARIAGIGVAALGIGLGAGAI